MQQSGAVNVDKLSASFRIALPAGKPGFNIYRPAWVLEADIGEIEGQGSRLPESFQKNQPFLATAYHSCHFLKRESGMRYHFKDIRPELFHL